jgi:hypothetical protein
MMADTDDLRLKAQEELDRILKSPAFHGSPRCSQFLQFVVDRALEGQYDALKERMIGIEVFGRNPSYQTEGDSVVRVRASDVRRRLSQYYSVTETAPVCRIDIPSGSYVPQFLMPTSESPALPAISGSLPEHTGEKDALARGSGMAGHTKGILTGQRMIAGLLILIALIAWFAHRRIIRPTTVNAESPVETAFQAFWAPALRNPKPVLICIGSPVAYNYSKVFRSAYFRRLHLKADDARNMVIDPSGTQLNGSDLVPVKNEFVGAGDANAASLLSALFGSLGKTTEFRISTETSYSELSDSPSILLGAFSNRWTERTMSRTPYVFVERNSVRFIQEQTGAKRSWTLPQLGVDGKTDEDYAIVSRILDAETGQFLVTAAGISGFGSRAAGYFLTRPEQMARELDKAPKGWMHENLQFVLRTHVVDGAPTAPEVVALTCW